MFYLINKKTGVSSYKAINLFARNFKEIKKIGHTGTLDPLASGLLLVATNDDTKLIPYIDKGYKTYKVGLELGKISSTFDIDGKITKTNKIIPKKNNIKSEILTFLGKQKQKPPVFSAKKVNGQRAYKLAREGQKFSLKKVNVEIKKIKNIKVKVPFVFFKTTVSRGTYIRSLVNDIGEKLNCGALMTSLIRTQIGSLSTNKVFKKISIFKILQIPIIVFNKKEIEILKLGKTITKNHSNGLFGLKFKKEILGIVNIKSNEVKVKKLFGNKLKKEGF